MILYTKYRNKVINNKIFERLREIFLSLSDKYSIYLEEWNHDKDHVYILFRAHPKSELSKYINAYKSASSRLIKKKYPSLRNSLFKEAFWAQSFCLLNSGSTLINVIRKYMETQGGG